MQIRPNLGIGDLFILKMKEISNNWEIKEIIITYEHLKKYRAKPESCLENIKKIIDWLFPGVKCTVDLGRRGGVSDFKYINFTKTYLCDDINLQPLEPFGHLYTNYIVFHTKVRLDGFMNDFHKTYYPMLTEFLTNFRTNKDIILLGERKIEANLESNVHKIVSIYDDLLKLGENNNVIDLTEEFLYSGNSDYDSFLRDLSIIKNADWNINIGIGGPFVFCNVFSKNNILFIGVSSFHEVMKMEEINPNLYRDFQKFLDKIQELSF